MQDMPEILLQEGWNASFDGMILTDEHGIILSFNRSAARLLSLGPNSLQGASIFEIIPCKELAKSFPAKKDKTGISLSLGTQQLVANLSIIRREGHSIYYLLILRNLSQIQQLQQQLLEMNTIRQVFDAILDQMEEGVCVIDQHGKILFYNRKMGEIDTLEPESVRGKRLSDVWSLDEHSSTLLTALNTGRTMSKRETHFTTNGKAVTTLCRTSPLHAGGKRIGAIEIARDITEQKQLTETILQLQSTTKRDSGLKARPSVSENNTRFHFQHIIYSSREMGQIVEQARRAARSASNILIVGETGTGKELFAQSIHNESPRRDKPFIEQNCAALPESLLEGLLFGTTVGSFTGAVDRAGLFEQAHGGTLFLDEVNSMGADLQAKLLRVLQERRIQRLGSSKLIDIDVRVIATINEDPQEAINKGKLRADLYYRLGVVTLVIPPLHKRKEDIPALIDHFIRKHAPALGVPVKGVEDDVYQFFMEYHWPGNVRQLEHAIEGALNLVYDETAIGFDHLSPSLKTKMLQQHHHPRFTEELVMFPGTLPEQIERIERKMIEQALRESKGNITKAGEILGISRQNLNYKLNKYKITV